MCTCTTITHIYSTTSFGPIPFTQSISIKAWQAGPTPCILIVYYNIICILQYTVYTSTLAMRANSITASAQPVTHSYIHCVHIQITTNTVTADSISLAAPHYFPNKNMAGNVIMTKLLVDIMTWLTDKSSTQSLVHSNKRQLSLTPFIKYMPHHGSDDWPQHCMYRIKCLQEFIWGSY